MRRWLAFITALLFSSAVFAFANAGVPLRELPAEAQHTYRLIIAGGPFPYERDGIRFHNREQRLPAQARGYYREYTVPTPGLNHRGPRRIISGGNPPEVFYYTPDHYKSFRRIEP